MCPSRPGRVIFVHLDEPSPAQALELGVDLAEARAPEESCGGLDGALDVVSGAPTVGEHAEDHPRRCLGALVAADVLAASAAFAFRGQIPMPLTAYFALMAGGGLTGALPYLAHAVAADAVAEPVLDVHTQSLLIFGVHLALVGLAIVRAPSIPTWIGVLVLIAGAGYAAVATLLALGTGSPLTFAEFTFIGEVVLLIWLIG